MTDMSTLRQFPTTIVICTCFAGCSGLTQIQDTVTKFDQGAHTLSTTQIAFAKSAQTADCNFQFYENVWNYSKAADPAPPIPLALTGPCVPEVMTNDNIAVRQNLLNAITLYADQIQAVASADSDKTLSAKSQDAAGKLNSLAKSHGLIETNGMPVAAAVEAAVIGITNMILSAKQLSDIKSSAKAQSANLRTIADHLQLENMQIAKNMAAKAGSVANMFETTIALVKQDGILISKGQSAPARANNPQVYLLAVSARQMLLNTPPLGVGMSATGSLVQQDSVTVASQLNSALESLVSANDAISNASTGGLIAEVADLVARAQAAQAMQAALAK